MEKKVNVNQRIDLFLENKTYVFIKLISGNVFNGYIQSKEKTSINFKDDKLGEIPILKDEISIIAYSNKGVVQNDS